MDITTIENRHFLLASKSPRRRYLLEQLGIEFSVVEMDHHETIDPSWTTEQVPEQLAVQKSHSFSGIMENQLLITADTIVDWNGNILHKPDSRDTALEMLRSLSNSTHKVHTGVCLRDTKRMRSFTETTEVEFGVLDEDEIEHYVDNYQPFDKAGGYGIQEWIGYIGVKRISGCYYNVMGLPLSRLYRELKEFLSLGSRA